MKRLLVTTACSLILAACGAPEVDLAGNVELEADFTLEARSSADFDSPSWRLLLKGNGCGKLRNFEGLQVSMHTEGEDRGFAPLLRAEPSELEGDCRGAPKAAFTWPVAGYDVERGVSFRVFDPASFSEVTLELAPGGTIARCDNAAGCQSYYDVCAGDEEDFDECSEFSICTRIEADGSCADAT